MSAPADDAVETTPTTTTTSTTTTTTTTASSNTTTAATPAECQFCGKTASELNHALKTCGKCKTVQYCSRECQKSDFKFHKRACRLSAAVAAEAAAAKQWEDFERPTDDEILKAATDACDLLVALYSSPEHRNASPEQPEPPILKHLISFMIRTMAEFWTPLLPRRKAMEFLARLSDDPVASMAEGNERLAQMRRVPVDTWPPFDAELFNDAIGRGVMACGIVLDDSRQSWFGMPPGKIYDWGEAVRSEARRQQLQMERQ